jgi:biotin carboxyl carrier protein
VSDTARTEVHALGNGRYLVATANVTQLAFAASTPEGVWVFVDGHTYLVTSSDEGPTRRRSDDQTALSAPMPATVIAVNVAPGQAVKAGDVMLLLEAMKMELPIAAPRDGVIKRLACREGELVQPGEPLIELEPPHSQVVPLPPNS